MVATVPTLVSTAGWLVTAIPPPGIPVTTPRLFVCVRYWVFMFE
jgi:hypothetical protein